MSSYDGPLGDGKIQPQGSWFDTYLGSAETLYVPYWLQREIKDYLGLPILYDIYPSWWATQQLRHDVAIGLATDIANREEFSILTGILSGEGENYDEEGYRLFNAIDEAAEKYAKWVRKTYFQKLKQFNEDRDICVLCEVSKRIIDSDICAHCRREYTHEEQRIRVHLYRARKAGTPATLTLGQWIKTLRRYNNRCAYCSINPYEVLEHYVPITSGGGTTEENCVPACRSCNSKKHDEHPEKLQGTK